MSVFPGEKSVNPVLHCLRLMYLLSTAVVHLCLIVPYLLLTGHVDPAHGHAMYDRMKRIEYLRALLRWELAGEFALQIVYYYIIYKIQGFIPALVFYMFVMVVH